MPNDFIIIKDALSRIERDKQNSWTEYVELIGTIDDLETENALLRKVAEAGEKAIKTLDNTCYLFAKADDRAIHNEAVKMFWQAFAELEKEGER